MDMRPAVTQHRVCDLGQSARSLGDAVSQALFLLQAPPVYCTYFIFIIYKEMIMMGSKNIFYVN